MDTERQLDLIKSTGSKRSHQLHQLVPEVSSERGRAGRAGNMIPELEKHGPPGRNSPTLLIYLRCSSALTLMWQADAFSSQKFTSITWIKLTFSELRGESRYKTKTGHLMHKYRLKGNFFFLLYWKCVSVSVLALTTLYYSLWHSSGCRCVQMLWGGQLWASWHVVRS